MRGFAGSQVLWVLLIGGVAAPGGTLAAAPDYAVVLGAFPRPGSAGDQADRAILLWLQRTRTGEEVRRAESELEPHPGIFNGVTGRDLDSDRFPLTRALLQEAQAGMHPVIGALKRRFARIRPYVAVAGLKPVLPPEDTGSYPSGHSAWAMLEASLLAEFLPRARVAILDRGRQMGYDRALGGVHYPSDVEGGQRVGAAFARDWLADPEHRRRLEQVRAAEW